MGLRCRFSGMRDRVASRLMASVTRVGASIALQSLSELTGASTERKGGAERRAGLNPKARPYKGTSKDKGEGDGKVRCLGDDLAYGLALAAVVC
jgi:hypothetical protein